MIVLALPNIRSLGIGTSLVVKWLRLHISNAGGMGSILGQGTYHGAWPKHEKNIYMGIQNLFQVTLISSESLSVF